MMEGKITPGTLPSRLLAVAVLALALVLFWQGLAQPVIDLAGGKGPLARARHEREELGRVTERLPALIEEKKTLAASRPAAASGFLPGTDPQLAAASLAGRLNADIKAMGGDLVSSEAVDLKEEETVQRAGLRLRVSLPRASLPNLLYRLEYSQPTLFIQTLAITADTEGRLTMALDLYGYLGGDEDEPAAPAAEIPAASFPDMVTRPLFTPSRHGAVFHAASLASASLRLAGLVAEQGRTIALISPDGGHEVKVGPGASLNGWRVAGIDGQGMDLAKDGRRLRVSLKQPIPPSD